MKVTLKSKKETKPIYLSQSAISRFLECRRKAKLSMEWIPKKSSRALRYGSFYHAMIEEATKIAIKYKRPPTEKEIEKAIQQYVKKWEDDNQSLRLDKTISQEMMIDQALIKVSILAYINNYAKDFDGTLTWISLEHKFEIPYRGIMMYGYIDSVYTDKHGLRIMETKTKSRISQDIVDLLHLDLQTFYYAHAYFLATGKFPGGTVYNICRKYEGKIKVNESANDMAIRFAEDLAKRPEHYFQRIPTLISREEYDNWVEFTLNPLIDDYKGWRAGTSPDYCNPTQCEGRYGSCDFLPICSRGELIGFKKKDKSGDHVPKNRKAVI